MNPKNLSTLLSCHSSQAHDTREKKVKPLIFPGFLKEEHEESRGSRKQTFFSSSLLSPKILMRFSPSTLKQDQRSKEREGEKERKEATLTRSTASFLISSSEMADDIVVVVVPDLCGEEEPIPTREKEKSVVLFGSQTTRGKTKTTHCDPVPSEAKCGGEGELYYHIVCIMGGVTEENEKGSGDYCVSNIELVNTHLLETRLEALEHVVNTGEAMRI
ncbi:hypothetical protein B296_00033545 [Ensete ventricosum]|uniref:Uncharacterized protein n=1 Tax=Ensete ventricosum TaxID=4639 RepID=A0A427AAL7_ENSVE|nr:hypothetical protein B296_00033545 [Ensete ventricosum]